jgi:hypothetical protein
LDVATLTRNMFNDSLLYIGREIMRRLQIILTLLLISFSLSSQQPIHRAWTGDMDTLTGYPTGAQTFYIGGRYYNPTPENDTIYFSSEQPATLDQVSIIFQTKTNQDTIWIDWGEDAPVWVSGITDQTKTSDYSAGSTTYNIKIYGDVDKITKFSVNETYVTFGAMSNNIGKMTGLTYLYLRNCTGVATCTGADIPTGLTTWTWHTLPNLTATINSTDIPTGLTSWTWHTLPNLTATVNSADIPDGLTTWYWYALPNLTATVNSADIPDELTTWVWYSLPNLTANVNSVDIPTELNTWYWYNLPNLTANVNSVDIPDRLTYWYWYALPNLTANVNSVDIPTGLTYWYWHTLPKLTANGLSITALSKALTVLTMSTMTLSTTRVNELLASMDTYYTGANLMTENATITLNGTGVGAPTDGASNTNIVSLTSKATSQGKMWTFVINTP